MERKPVSALGAALALYEAGVLEIQQDVLEELDRDLLRLRKALALDRTSPAAASSAQARKA